MKTLLLSALLLTTAPLLSAPFVASINRQPQTTLAVSGTSTIFRVTFTESVTGVDVTDFTLLKVGTVNGTIASISGSGATYDITVNGISGFGTLRLDLKHTGTGIIGSGSVAIADGFDNGQSIRVGTTVPIGWGNHVVGQIGDGTAVGGNKTFPTAVSTSGVLSGKNIVQMASGANWTTVLTADNLLFAWGGNTVGQIGNGTSTSPQQIPVAVDMSGVLSGKTIISLACGDNFTLALDSDGKVYGWGSNSQGQLGIGSVVTPQTSPVAVISSGALNGKVVTGISAGTNFAVACTSDGGIYTWGRATTGRLGNGDTVTNVISPAQLGGVFTGKRVVAVSGGGAFGAALTSDGRVYTWGNNNIGQLGDGGTISTPTENATPAGILGTGLLPGSRTVANITCTFSGMYAIARDGSFYAWGGGGSGGLGNGGTTSSTSPVLVDTTGVLSGKTIAAITGGNNFASVLTTEGKLYSWGTNASGQLGDGTTDQRNNPIAVDVSASSALNGKTVSFLSSAAQPTFMMAGAGVAAAPPPAPVVTNVTSSTANGAYNASDAISIQVTFDASVTVTGTPQLTLETGTTDRVLNYSSGSPGTTLTFNYTVQAGDTTADLDYISTSALSLNGGTINATTGATAATLTLPSPGASGSLGANKALVIDTTAPTINIGSPSVSTIAAGAGSVTYTVTYADTNFDASTLANGNITLNSTGSANATVGVSGSGTTRTVTLSSITGSGSLGITIASGTASDTAGNTAGAAGPSTTFAVTAPASGPSPTGTPAHQFTNSSTMASFTVPAGPRRLLVVSAGDPGTPTNPTSVTFNGTPMLLGNSTSDGTFSCDSIWYLALGNGPAITGSINVAFGGLEFRYIGAASFSNVDQTTPVDTNGPKISGSVQGTNPSSSLDVTSQAGDLVFDLFDAYGTTAVPTTTAGANQTVVNTVGALWFDPGYYSRYSTSTEPGAATVPMSWTTANTGAILHLTMNINGSGAAPTPAPVVTGVTSSTANGAYNASDAISIQVTFDASVTVTGTPQLTLETGTTDRVLNYSSGSPGTTLTFNYTVQAGDTTADLDYLSTSALSLNGGTINATTGATAATLTLPSPGASGSLGANKALVIDTTAPTINIGSPSVSTITAGAGSVTYTVTYADTNFNASTLANGNITLNSTGSANATVNVTGSGTTRTVTLSSITGSGSLGITIASGTASDTAGNLTPAAGPSTTFTVTAPPTVTLTTNSVNANASSITITGTNFDTTPGNNTVAFTPAGTGTVTAATATSLTVSVSSLRAGALNAVVTNGNGNSGAPVQVATVVPVITANTSNLANTATTLTINGFGFDPTPANNTVAFSPTGTGTVTASTATTLTVTGIAGLTNGALNAIVTSNSQASASAQVATVTTGVAPAPGFLYVLSDVNGASNQIYGYSVDEATGALTALAGFPVATGSNGIGQTNTEQLALDAANRRLYAINRGGGTVSAYAIGTTGALTALPFSPINLGAGAWSNLAVHPSGSPLVVGRGTGSQIFSFNITATTATAAAGSPYSTGTAAGFSNAFSRDGNYVYTGGNTGTTFAGFSVNATTGVLTALAGSPFSSVSNAVGYCTDSDGRLFMGQVGGGALRVFTTAAGIPTPVTGNPFATGLTNHIHAVLHPNGFYAAADRVGNRVGVYKINGSGAATTLAAVSGSPFAAGGTTTNTLALNQSGAFLFAANGGTRNLTTFSVDLSTGVLTSPVTQPANTLGTTGLVNGLGYIAAAAAPTVIASTTSVNADATSITITGTGFDASTPGNNTVAFTPTGTGTVTAATATSLTVSVSGLRAGALNAVVTNGAGNSGTAAQVATVVPVITSSTANLLSTASTLTIIGFGFDPTPGNNTITFSPSGTGTVTASTATSLTVTSITGLTAGALNAIVTSNGQTSASAQVATIVPPAPTVTLTTTSINANAPTLTITGNNFDTTPGNNTVALTPFGTGTVTASTATSLTVSVSGLRAGPLSAVVTTNSVSSGAPVQVATVRPVITPSTLLIAPTAQTLTIDGFGFDPTASNNTVAFSPAGTGTVSAATATTLTITDISGLNLGTLNAVVTSNSQASTSTQVANVLLLPAASVSLSGSAAPGIPNATFNFLGDISLNESGHTVLYGRVSGPSITTANDAGVWINDGSGFSLMLREGGSTGTSGQTIAEPIRFGRITDTGITHVMSGVAGAPSTANAAGWVANGTSFTSFYRKGTTFLNAFNGVSQQIAADDGYFAAQLKLVTGSVTAANDTGIWKIASNGTTTVAAREGQLIAGSTTRKIGNLMSRVAVSSSGFGTYPAYLTAVAPSVLPSTQNRAILKQNFASVGEPVIVAQSYVTTVPGISGAQFNTFQSESINATGNIAFGALLVANVAGVTTANDFGLWHQGTSGLELALREGQAVPNRPGVTFKTVMTHWLLDDGSLVFHGTTSANDQGLWHVNTAGSLTQLLGLGQPIPQANNATFSAFYLRPDVSPSGKFAAAGTLTLGSAGTTTANNRLLLLGDVATPGVFSHAIRSGNTYSVNSITRTIRNLYLGFTTGNEATTTGGTGGMSRVINNAGRAAIWLQFADGTFGHFVTDDTSGPQVLPPGNN